MKWFIGAAIAGGALWLTSGVQAQTQTVQLPTFNFSTVSTTVTVPDGGTALLGGINRARESSVTRGLPMLSKIPGVNRLFTNRGIGRDVGAMNMTVTPRIIILEEEELRQTGFSYDSMAQVGGAGIGAFSSSFGGAVATPVAAVDPAEREAARKAAFLNQHAGRPMSDGMERDLAVPSGVDERLPSLAEIRRQNEQAALQRNAEAQQYFAQGQRAQSEGKAGVAKIYYQMALRRADATLTDEIMACLSALDTPSAAAELAEQ
jgi:hypothetical protein